MKTWAPWAADAPGEIGQEEWPGARWNPRIKEYQSKGVMSHFNDEGPSTMPPYEGGYNAWCACFVSWALDSTGFEPLSGYSAQRAKAYQNWGQDPGFPAFGAVSVVGSHVGFAVGATTYKKVQYIALLGGNQGDAVNIKWVPRSSFSSFRVPHGVTAKALNFNTSRPSWAYFGPGGKLGSTR